MSHVVQTQPREMQLEQQVATLTRLTHELLETLSAAFWAVDQARRYLPTDSPHHTSRFYMETAFSVLSKAEKGSGDAQTDGA